MALLPSAISEPGALKTLNDPGPKFCPWNGPLEEHTILVQSNEVHLIPLGNQKCHQRLEVTAQDTLDGFPTAGKRLTDDIIIFSSRSGVIFGRIPNSLSDDAVVQWLESFVEYVSTSEEAAWWHTGHSGPWVCHVFAPKNATLTKCIYSNTRNGSDRPWVIANILDAYTQNNPWLVQVPDQEYAESYVAAIDGKYYVPRQHKRRRNAQRQNEQSKESNPTRISFIWDPVEYLRDVVLRDEQLTGEHLVERVKMSLI